MQWIIISIGHQLGQVVKHHSPAFSEGRTREDAVETLQINVNFEWVLSWAVTIKFQGRNRGCWKESAVKMGNVTEKTKNIYEWVINQHVGATTCNFKNPHFGPFEEQ